MTTTQPLTIMLIFSLLLEVGASPISVRRVLLPSSSILNSSSSFQVSQPLPAQPPPPQSHSLLNFSAPAEKPELREKRQPYQPCQCRLRGHCTCIDEYAAQRELGLRGEVRVELDYDYGTRRVRMQLYHNNLCINSGSHQAFDPRSAAETPLLCGTLEAPWLNPPPDDQWPGPWLCSQVTGVTAVPGPGIIGSVRYRYENGRYFDWVVIGTFGMWL